MPKKKGELYNLLIIFQAEEVLIIIRNVKIIMPSSASQHPFHSSKCAPLSRALLAMLAVSLEPDNTSLKSLITLKSLKTERVNLFGAERNLAGGCLAGG